MWRGGVGLNASPHHNGDSPTHPHSRCHCSRGQTQSPNAQNTRVVCTACAGDCAAGRWCARHCLARRLGPQRKPTPHRWLAHMVTQHAPLQSWPYDAASSHQRRCRGSALRLCAQPRLQRRLMLDYTPPRARVTTTGAATRQATQARAHNHPQPSTHVPTYTTHLTDASVSPTKPGMAGTRAVDDTTVTPDVCVTCRWGHTPPRAQPGPPRCRTTCSTASHTLLHSGHTAGYQTAGCGSHNVCVTV